MGEVVFCDILSTLVYQTIQVYNLYPKHGFIFLSGLWKT